MHYKHEWFERELTSASGKQTLAEAAPFWELSHFGVVDDGEKRGNCQICHARIVNFVAIRNVQNNMTLLIGHDCYDKLLHYLATSKVESINLPERKKQVAVIKQYCRREIDAAFLAWFATRKRLPESVRQTLAVIRAMGYAPSIKAAEELVEYYKSHRTFRLLELLGDRARWLFGSFSHKGMLPKKITLSDLLRAEAIIVRGDEITRNVRAYRKTEKEAVIQKVATEYAEKGIPLPLLSPVVSYDSGVYWPGSGYDKLPRLEVEFNVGPARISAEISRQIAKNALGVCNWTKKCTAALQASLPTEILLIATKNGLAVDDDFVSSWLNPLFTKEREERECLRAERYEEQKARCREEDRKKRQQNAIRLGLPEDASWEQIEQAEEEARKQREEREELRREQELAERRKNATHLAFRKGRNPKTGCEQWQAHFQGWLCVLRREDEYALADGEIPAEGILELVPGRIMLVKRI